MKKILLAFAMGSFLISFSQTPCTGGFAGPYPCNGYLLQSELDLTVLNAGSGNDSWGWTDPMNGKEYALVGLNNGTAFIDISNPTNPVYLGKLPTQTTNSSWRDVKTYNNHAFIVSEASNHGMQVFDLTRLRNVTNPPETFTVDAHYSGFGRAHNIVINEDSGYAYAVGTSTFNGGPHFVNITDPVNPTAAGGYAMDNYSHDAQVVIYCGPDNDYIGREILIGSNEDEVIIADITNKANPVHIASVSYSNVGYTHQGWFTEDQRYFILGDELDESNVGFNTRTLVFDFEDLDNPQFDFAYTGATPAIDHNGYVKGKKYYMANYRAGLRVLDISNIENGTITEEGFFDSYPNNNNANFSGAWNVFPYFASGNIVISDMNRGFLLVRANNPDLTAPVANCTNATLELDANGEAVLNAADIDNGSFDNSGIVYLQICDDQFDCSDLGANSVTLEVYDKFGNKDYCTATVTVVDNLAAEISCPSELTRAFDAGQSFYTLEDFTDAGEVTIMDNCTNPVPWEQDPVSGTQLTEGTYTITVEATDASGNVSSCSFPLHVVEVLGVSDHDLATGLMIYPNPTSDVIHVTSENVALTSLAVYDVLGRNVYSQTVSGVLNHTLDLASLPGGVYFLKVNDRITKRIIKN